jgi:hypothetical protein
VRIAGVAYAAFLVLSAAGMTLRSLPIQVVGNASGFVLSVLLYRLFAPTDPRAALALLPLALVHYVVQAVGQVRADTDLRRLALLPFAPYLLLLGYLIATSTFAPTALGALIALAGLAWLLAVVPAVPTSCKLAAFVFGFAAEVALAIWLLTAPES